MILTVIPFSTVCASLSRQRSEWNSQENDTFNTPFRTLSEITAALPPLPGTDSSPGNCIVHVIPDLRTEHLSNWLPVVAASQRLGEYHVIELSHLCVTALLNASKSWALNDNLSGNVLDEVEEWFPSTTSCSFFAAAAQTDDAGLPSTNTTTGRRCGIDELLATKNFFVRLDFCSAKDASRERGIPRSRRDLISKLVSSMRVWRALQDFDVPQADSGVKEGEVKGKESVREREKARVYLLPFRPEMDSRREWRVFCPPPAAGEEVGSGVGRVVAVSQYSWHQPWQPAGQDVVEEGWRDMVKRTAERVLKGVTRVHGLLVEHAERLKREEERAWVMERMVEEGFTFDVFDTREEVQLVEVNPFGAMSGCGSCLFHWIRDAEVLYGRRKEVEFRVAVEEGDEGEKIDC